MILPTLNQILRFTDDLPTAYEINSKRKLRPTNFIVIK